MLCEATVSIILFRTISVSNTILVNLVSVVSLFSKQSQWTTGLIVSLLANDSHLNSHFIESFFGWIRLGYTLCCLITLLSKSCQIPY